MENQVRANFFQKRATCTYKIAMLFFDYALYTAAESDDELGFEAYKLSRQLVFQSNKLKGHACGIRASGTTLL